MVATGENQKPDVPLDESDLIWAWLKVIIQYHSWKKPKNPGTEEHKTRGFSRYYNPNMEPICYMAHIFFTVMIISVTSLHGGVSNFHV